jgi:hypothetical protein
MSSILQKQQGLAAGTPITVTTTTETLVAYTGRCECNLPTLRSIIKGWLAITTGTGVTALVLQIRRGNGITGASIASVTVAAAASTQLTQTIKFSEQLSFWEYADYSFTVTQTGATGNGSITAGLVEVEQING